MTNLLKGRPVECFHWELIFRSTSQNVVGTLKLTRQGTVGNKWVSVQPLNLFATCQRGLPFWRAREANLRTDRYLRLAGDHRGHVPLTVTDSYSGLVVPTQI